MKERLREFIIRNFLFDKGSVGDEEHLFNAGIVDSFGFTELLRFLEESFAVTFDRSEIEIGNFDTINHIQESVERKLKA